MNCIEKRRKIFKKAVEAYAKNLEQKISRLACEFDVMYNRLLHRIRGRPSRSDRIPSNRRLTVDQKTAVKRWVRGQGNIGIPPTTSQIEAYANSVLQ